jgi:hypothetical protein
MEILYFIKQLIVIHLFLLINKLFQLLRTNSMAHHQNHKKLELKPEPAKEAITDA